MVMAQSLFITLKQQNPDVLIDVLAPAWSKPLLVRMPQVNEALDMPLGHGAIELKARYRLGKSLRSKKYDQAILLPNSWKSALVPWFARIPIRTGWRGEMRYGLVNDIRLLDKQKYPLMVERFNALAFPVGTPLPDKQPLPRLQVKAENTDQLLQQFNLNKNRPILVLCPGAEFGPAKRWPEGHYAEVARIKISEGWQVWIMGSAKDQPVADSILAIQPENQRSYCRVLAGNTSLEQAIDLISLADAVVSNDSGLMHISAALQRPLAVVYGSTSPGFTPPLSDNVAILSIPVDCGPCFQRECPLGHLKCLNDLSPQMVLTALDRLEKQAQ